MSQEVILCALAAVGLLQLVNLFFSLTSRGNASLRDDIVNSENSLRGEFARNREESQRSAKEGREELSKSLLSFETRLDKIRDSVENKIRQLQEGNEKKLEEMRATVDEKLSATIEKRFNASFNMISERLEQVHKGLGEMQNLATGVGDLKKVLTNVKTRGNMGEIQLGALLEETFSPEQYERNAAVKKDSQERVEFAIRLPGRDTDSPVLLPIDSKFPNEDYQRLLEAYEGVANTDAKHIEDTQRQFEISVKKCAKDIRDKYLNPPMTTDFGIMFVPTEGLYAEIMRRTGLFEFVRREYNVTIVGPTNLSAFLSSLRMGFRTLAIEKRSSEVWQLLSAVKTEFGKFGTVLEQTQKKLQEAANKIGEARTRTSVLERKLKDVEALPQAQAQTLIGSSFDIEEDAEEEAA
jgi:DNA recombination protein RmuC